MITPGSFLPLNSYAVCCRYIRHNVGMSNVDGNNLVGGGIHASFSFCMCARLWFSSSNDFLHSIYDSTTSWGVLFYVY